MKKEELIKRVGELESRLRSLELKDSDVREYLSGFLGSYKKRSYLNDEVEILDWPEIYFRLGQKFVNADLTEQVRFHTNDIVNIQEWIRKQEEKHETT